MAASAAAPGLVNLSGLMDDAKCFAFVRQHRWPEGVRCPGYDTAAVIHDGCDDSQPHRQRYRCKECARRFDDLTDTVLAGHHQPLANVQQKTIQPVIETAVAKGARIHTDEYDIYARLPTWGYRHKTVCHARGEYAREIRMATASARSTSIRWRGRGLYCAPGSARIEVSRKGSCRSISASLSSCTTPGAAAKPSSAPLSPLWSCDGPHHPGFR